MSAQPLVDFEVTTDGFDEHERQLVNLIDMGEGKAAEAALRAAGRKAMRGTLATAQQLCRKKDGSPDRYLAASIKIVAVKPRDVGEALRIGLTFRLGKVVDKIDVGAEDAEAARELFGAGAEGVTGSFDLSRRANAGWRGWWRENGTATQAAIPFLRPAADMHREEQLETFKQELGRQIDKAIDKVIR